ncbi:hypothetical protein [Deinococcus navajonensis]|uniref:Uncharacterized protein n=1 Tax=Deinococcus navajonensis TaxID=309884 RepID=A0ABV8XN07_9DEIO
MDQVLNMPLATEPQRSPQAALSDWLALWQGRQYGVMARRMPLPLHAGKRRLAPEVRAAYPPGLLAYNLLTGYDTDAAVAVIPAVLVRLDNGERRTQLWRFRMMHLDGAHQPLPRDRSGGRWVLQSASVIPTPPVPGAPCA